MRFLSIADRELRSAARQKATYRTRWLTATLFFGLLVWVLWAFNGFTSRGAAPQIFRVFSVLTLLYCLFLATARTADCIGAERREGTLGLLFLTNVNSLEIIAGKLCSSALASVYGLIAIFPMLGLPLLMGGITFGHFARTLLALLATILFALGAGFLTSVLCKRQFTAIALAMGATLAFTLGLMLGSTLMNAYGPTRPLAAWVAPFTPLYTLMAANGSPFFGANHFWLSAGIMVVMSLGCLGLATLLLARTWRDQPKHLSLWHWLASWRRSGRGPSIKSGGLRRRMLAINPLFWLAARQSVSAPIFMLLVLVLAPITVYVAAPVFERVMGTGTSSPLVGYWFAWLWTGLAIHGLVLYYAANCASQRLAEDKESGALELILSTPITERAISRGLWLAYARKLFSPALIALLVHAFFIWMLLVLMTVEPPGEIPSGVTPGELFRSALFNQPLRGQPLEWQFGFILRIPLLVLLQLILTWPTLGWVARWLGLRMKHPGFAPITSLALLFVPPVLLFSLACYLAGKIGLYRLAESRYVPMMMWVAFAIGSGHCLALSVWSAIRLRKSLRSVALSRYQPLPPWRWRLPSRRIVLRFAIGTAASAGGIVLLLLAYYRYQNWHSHRSWKSFQNVLKQRGESLTLFSVLPGPIPDTANFARSTSFLRLVTNTNGETKNLFEQVVPFDLPLGGYQVNTVLMNWFGQTNSPLLLFASWGKSKSGPGRTRPNDASAILESLQSQAGTLRELAVAARVPSFQISTNRDPHAVLHPDLEKILWLERLHLLFQVRACASLALGRNADAAEDVVTGLHLARLARQLPDVHSTVRVQGLLMRSLQPLWEGLAQHVWTEPQLASFQHELAGFNLLADYTNAVHRVVLAEIGIWSAIPGTANSPMGLLVSDSNYANEPLWRLQPRAWWFESCIQLYAAGSNAIQRVDFATSRIQPPVNWSDLSGLPVDSSVTELLQQSWWWGANPSSVAFAQTSVNQAILACALERFRLLNGVYPENLGELVPRLLDRVLHDAVSGRPLIYQHLGDGRFILRGVGPNGIDDRKIPAGSDDWLWTYPTNTPSATNYQE